MASLIDYMLQTQNAVGANTKQDLDNAKSQMMNNIYQQNPLLAVSGSLPPGFAGQALFANMAKNSPLTANVGGQVDQYNQFLTDSLNARAQHNYNLVANAGERLAPPEVKLAMVNGLLGLGYNANQAQDIITRGYGTSVMNQQIAPQQFYSNMSAVNPNGQSIYQQQPQVQQSPQSILQTLTGGSAIPSAPLAGLGGVPQVSASPLNAAQGQVNTQGVGAMLGNPAPQPVTAASITSTAPSVSPLNSAQQSATSQADKNIVQSKINKDTTTSAIQNQQKYNEIAGNLYNGATGYIPSVQKYAGYSGAFDALTDSLKAGGTATSKQDYDNLVLFKQAVIPLANEIKRTLGGQATDQETKIMSDFTTGEIWKETPSQVQQKWNQLGNLINTSGASLKKSSAETNEGLGSFAKVQPISSSPVDMIAPDGTHGSATPEKVTYLISKGYRRANG